MIVKKGLQMDNQNVKNLETQLRKGLLSYCILSLASKGDIYTSQIISSLKEANMIVSEGTLYPLLNRLSKNDYLLHKWEESSGGPPKKHYHISKEGEIYLKQLQLVWKDIVKNINKLTKEKA
jgi:PadR family transcriptional regulator PadR